MIVGLMWCLCAVILAAGLKNVEKDSRTGAMALCVFFGFFGACGVLGGLIKSSFLLLTCTLLSVAILCIGAVVMAVWKQKSCKVKISGVYLGAQVLTGRRGRRSYLPVFKYYFRGREYQRIAQENYSLKKLNARFCQGKTYPIWINEKVPDAYITIQKLDGRHIVVLLAGLLMLFLYAVGVLGLIILRFAPALEGKF